MSSPTQRMAYIDIYENVFEPALNDPRGLRIPFDTHGEAKYFQMRCHTARAVDRRDNLSVYPEGHQLHGASIYDKLSVTIRNGEDGTYFVYVEHRATILPAIEMLSEIEAEEADDQANS